MITLRNDDCLEVLRTIDDNSIDLVVTDPPYDIGKCGSGGCFGSEKRAYHNELRDAGLRDGIANDILEELVRVMKKINIYLFCNKNQFRQYINFFESRGCSTDILTWHKTNPVPTCNNKYLSDTEYVLYFREKGVPLYGTYATKHKYWVTPTNVADKKKYGHPTIKPLEIAKTLVENSSLGGGYYIGPIYGVWDYGSCVCSNRKKFLWH